jgi:hypothetical protein
MHTCSVGFTLKTNAASIVGDVTDLTDANCCEVATTVAATTVAATTVAATALAATTVAATVPVTTTTIAVTTTVLEVDATTTETEPVVAGTTEVAVSNETAFHAGQMIVIDKGLPTEETNYITQTQRRLQRPHGEGRELTTVPVISVATPWKFTHAVGATIIAPHAATVAGQHYANADASTALKFPVGAGAYSLPVYSTSGFVVGRQILVDYGAINLQEVAFISAVIGDVSSTASAMENGTTTTAPVAN